MSVLFVGTDLSGGTIQAGPFDAVRVRRLPKGNGICDALDPNTAGFIPVATHTGDGPWKYQSTLELEEFTIVSAPDGVGTPEPPGEEPALKPRRKPGPKPGGRRKKTTEPTPVNSNEAQSALGVPVDPIEEEIKKAEAQVS